MKFKDRIMKVTESQYGHMDKEELEKLAIWQNEQINDKDKTIDSYAKQHWTQSNWYWIFMYLIGLGSGAFTILTLQALGVLYG